jgi:small subunit ribosomal protein S20
VANLKSAQKRAKQEIVKRKRNTARKSSIKTAVKKVLESIERGDDIEVTKELLRDAESQLARAGGKGTLHKKTAARKISRLAKRVTKNKV